MGLVALTQQISYFPEFFSHFVNLLFLFSFLASPIGIYWVCWSKRSGDNKAKTIQFLTMAVWRILQMILLLWNAVHISNMNHLTVNGSWDNYINYTNLQTIIYSNTTLQNICIANLEKGTTLQPKVV